MIRIIITSSSKTATSIVNSQVTQSIPVLDLEESSSLRLVKVIGSNLSGGNYAVLCDSIDPSILNNSYIPCLGVFHCPSEKTFETDSFDSVPLSAKRLSSLRLSLFDIEKGAPAEPMKGRTVKIVYVLEVSK